MADLTLTHAADRQEATTGDPIYYTTMVENTSTAPLQIVTLEYTTKLTNAEYSLDGGSTYTPLTGAIPLGDIPVGESRRALLRGRVGPDIPLDSSSLDTTATAAYRAPTGITQRESTTAGTIIQAVNVSCDSRRTRYRAYTNIVESVAAEESAQGFLITMEGMKLDATLRANPTPQVLLGMNQSINRLVTSTLGNNTAIVLKYMTATAIPADTSCQPLDDDAEKRRQALDAVIQSVAEEETGMANLMDKEADKITAVSKHPDASIDDLLQVNESVKKMIVLVRRMNELMLQKLNRTVSTYP